MTNHHILALYSYGFGALSINPDRKVPLEGKIAMPDPLETAKLLFDRRKDLLRLGNYTEEETVSRLIDPVLAYLEYPVENQRRELQSGGNRPDIIIYPMSASKARNKPADIILEAKPLKTDLDGVGLPRSKRPKIQLARYMLGLDASQPGTFGVLTEGNIWHVVIRTSSDAQPKLVKEWRLLDSTIEDCSTWLSEIKDTAFIPDISSRWHHKATREIQPRPLYM